MPTKTWKQDERDASVYFGGHGRTPLSGGNSKHTRADVIHDALFIECKRRKKQAIWTLYEETAKLAELENKTPVLWLKQTGKQGALIVVHCDDLCKL